MMIRGIYYSIVHFAFFILVTVVLNYFGDLDDLQVFFNPEIYSSEFTTPLPAVIDRCIQSAPIDTRRALYKVK